MRIFWVMAALVFPVPTLLAEVPEPTSQVIKGVIEKVQVMQPYEAARDLGYFIHKTTQITTLDERLEVAEAGVWLARHHPEWMQQKLFGSEGSVGPQAIAALFALLTDSVEEKEQQILIPPLHPKMSLDDEHRDASPRDAASLQYMKRRRELHEELCTLVLQQPVWAENALRDLSAAWLADGKPTKEEMRSYVQKAVDACEKGKTNVRQVGWLLDDWIDFVMVRRCNDEQRLRLLQLALPFGVVALREPDQFKRRVLKLLTCVADETQRHPGQRCELVEELWRLACADAEPAVRRAVFPVWAAHQFDCTDDISGPIHHAGEFKSLEDDPYLLQAVIAACVPDAHRFPQRLQQLLPQQLRLAKFMDDILFEAPALLKNEEIARAVADAANRLTQHNANEQTKPLLARAEEARARLLEHLVGHSEGSPDALFFLLRTKVMAGADTREIEKQLIAMTAANAKKMEESLKRFIADGNGTFQKRDDKASKPEGYLGGCWDLRQRNPWYAAALRVGRELSKHNTNRWLDAWLHSAAQGNWLAVPRVPSCGGYEVARRPAGGYDPRYFPAADLLHARDDLLIEGHELALSLNPYYEFFRNYSALMLARTPPDTAPVVRWLRHDPAKTGFKLYDMLGTCPDTLESELAVAGILETFIKEWPADNTQTEWVTSIRSCLLGLSVPILKGVQWQRYSNSMYDLHHELPVSQTRHATYLHLMHLAMQKPVLEARLFPEYARVHLAKEPDLVLASAQRVLAHDPPRFYSGLNQIFSDTEWSAPPARRLEWARLLLRLLPVLKKQTAAGPQEMTPWLERVHQYCRVKNTEPKSPLWDELLTLHGQFVSGFTARMEFSPQLLDAYAAAQFARGASWESVLQQIKAACAVEESARSVRLDLMNHQMWSWCARLNRQDGTTKERLWAAEIMLGMCPLYPPGSGPNWMEHTSMMLAATAKAAPASLKTVLQLQRRLIQGAMHHPYPLGGVLWDLGVILAREGESLNEFEQYCLALALANPRSASDTLNRCLSRDQSSMELKPGGLPLMKAVLHVLQQWPDDAPEESYAWTRELIDTTGDEHSVGMNGESIIGFKRKNPLPLPASSAECIAFQTSVLAELHRRKVQLSWMPAFQLRLAWRSHADLHDFFQPDRRESTLAYLSEVLSFDLHNCWRQNDPSSIQSSKFFTPHRNAQEVMEATRILQAATTQKLLDPTTAQPLRQQATRCLKQIIELGEEVSKICSRVPDGTWAGAVHQSQKKEAEELKAALDAKPD